MADVKALVVRLEADLNGLKAGMAEASGEITKFTKQSDALGGSTMRNWQMANRMGSSFQGVAMSMGGVGTQGRMLFGVLDNMGDYFERASLRGLSFKDALKNLRGEIGMMASAGAVMAASAIFDAMQKSAQQALDAANQVLGVLERMTADVMDKKFQDMMNAQRKNYENGKLTYNQYHEWLESRQKQYAAEVSKAQTMASEAVAMNDKKAKVEQVKAAEQMYRRVSKAAQATAQELERIEAIHQNELIRIDKEAEEKKRKLKLKEMEVDRALWKEAEEQLKREQEMEREALEYGEALSKEKEAKQQEIIARTTAYYQTAADRMASLTVSMLSGEVAAWKKWASQIIAEIERVIAKKLMLSLLGGIFGPLTGGGGILGTIGGWLAGSSSMAGSPMNIVIHNLPPGAYAEIITGSLDAARPGTKARLSQVVARGNVVNAKR